MPAKPVPAAGYHVSMQDILISSWSWGMSQSGGIVSPRDPASGQATGK